MAKRKALVISSDNVQQQNQATDAVDITNLSGGASDTSASGQPVVAINVAACLQLLKAGW